jgi:hypothetical protein
MKVIKALGIVLTWCLVAAWPLAAQVPAAQADAAISGVVRDGTTRQPVPGAVVELRAPSTGAPLARITRQVTDDRGRFVFRELAAGEGYSLRASRPGYVTGDFGQSVTFGPAGRITLDEGEWFPSADISLWKPAAINGRVIDERNEPVVGAYVRALARVLIAGEPQLLAGPVTRTDDRGEYRLAGLAAGTYVIFVPSPSATVPADAPSGVLGAPTAPPRSGLILSLPGPPRTDAVLDPVDGYRSVIGNFPTPPPADNSGTRRVYAPAFHPGVHPVDAAQPVTVALGEERTAVDIALVPTPVANVFGRVVGPPEALKSLVLRLIPRGLEGLSNGAEAAAALVAADGSVAFLGVPPGEYIIDSPSVSVEFTMESAAPMVSLPAPPGIRWGSSQSGTIASGPPGTGFLRQQAPRAEEYWTRTTVSVGAADVRDLQIDLQPTLVLRGRLEYSGTTEVTVAQAPVGRAGAGGASSSTLGVTRMTMPRPSTQPSIVAEPAAGQAWLGLPRTTRPREGESEVLFTMTGLKAGEYVLRSTSGLGRYMIQSVVVDGINHTHTPINMSRLRRRARRSSPSPID